ncbi:MAG: hypothetical protein FJ102_21225 [Deltaproteobacteria bacterium]|nr:hypothetical protein [Deltaproteobacteria bacterium]
MHAKIAVPEWRALAAHVDEPGLRAEAEAMADRLARLDEDAERLARAEYDLTQRLITLGGWKPTASRQLQRLNSEAARVIQGE